MTLQQLSTNRFFISFFGYALGSLLLSACVTPNGILQDRNFKKRDTQYQIGDPGKNWRRLYVKGADLAWINKQENATLLVNSQCKEATDISLLALTAQLLIGLTEQNIEKQTTLAWSQREALETIMTAKIDGVSRKMAIFVFKKNGCTYDIVFAAPLNLFDIEITAYQAVRDEFNVGGHK